MLRFCGREDVRGGLVIGERVARVEWSVIGVYTGLASMDLINDAHETT